VLSNNGADGRAAKTAPRAAGKPNGSARASVTAPSAFAESEKASAVNE
jgi:hypothetical protein